MAINTLQRRRRVTLTTRKKELFGLDAETIKYYRRNPSYRM